MHIDNFDPSTFLWILKDFDFPYVAAEWNAIRDRKDPSELNGMSVIGKYLAKMRLKKWSNYTWADTEMLQKKSEEQRIAREEEISKFYEGRKELKEISQQLEKGV